MPTANKSAVKTIGFNRPQKTFSRYKTPLAPVPDLVEPQRDSFAWFIEKGLKEVFADFKEVEDFSR